MKHFDNFNEKNIENIRKHMKEPLGNNGKVWILNEIKLGPCKVTITKESRKICAEALLK